MKKTEKTALTAAAFAAAMNLASCPATLNAEADDSPDRIYYSQTLSDMFDKNVGDIDGDGGIGLTDVIFLYKYLINQQTMTYEQYVSADVNQDERVNIFDFILLKQALLSIEEIPVPVYGPPDWFDTTETETVTETIPQTVYGPPEWFTNPTETEEVPQPDYGSSEWFDPTEPETEPVTETLPEPMYGPPEYFGITENPEE